MWQSLGDVCGKAGSFVKDMCLKAAHVSYHFLWRRVLCPAQMLPWSLCRGNVQENLEELAQGGCPEEPVSKQLWMLLGMKHNMSELVQVVRLIGQVGWTSLPAEQQHGTLSMVKKWHPDYGLDTLMARSLLLQISRLLPSASADEKKGRQVAQEAPAA